MFAIRLKELRKAKGVTQEQLAVIIGVERSSIGKYEGKSGVIPSDDIKYRIAEYFGVTVEYLMGRSDDPSPISPLELSPDEREILTHYRTLNQEGRRAAISMIRGLAHNEEYSQEHAKKALA